MRNQKAWGQYRFAHSSSPEKRFTKLLLTFGCQALFMVGLAVAQDSPDGGELSSRLREIEDRYEVAILDANEARRSALEELVKQLTREGRFDEAEFVQETLAESLPSDSADSGSPPISHPAAKDFLEALEEYRAATEEFDAGVAAAFEERISAATAAGDLAAVRQLQAAQEQVKTNAFAPISDPKLEREIERLAGRMERLQVVLERERNTAINRMVSEGMTDEANAAMEIAMQAVQNHSRWQVLFLGTDSSNWNTSSNQWNSWARPVTEVRQAQFLRLRRLDTNEIVIIPMEIDQLGQRFDQGTVGWSGNGYEHEDITHIGIFKKDFQARQGQIVIGSDGFTPYTGWGIGHRHNVRGRGPAVSWAGEEIRLIALEISVTAAPLATAERRSLLIDPR